MDYGNKVLNGYKQSYKHFLHLHVCSFAYNAWKAAGAQSDNANTPTSKQNIFQQQHCQVRTAAIFYWRGAHIVVSIIINL
jgi:hypothetical protein